METSLPSMRRVRKLEQSAKAELLTYRTEAGRCTSRRDEQVLKALSPIETKEVPKFTFDKDVH
jgi:hypothetical protein